MLRKISVILVSVLLLVSLLASCAPKQQAQGAAQFYKEKPATLIIPAGEGGTADLIGRLAAQHWVKMTGGQMAVKNVASGGHIEGTNQVYAADPDGLTLGIGMGGTIQSPALSSPGCKWDATKFNYLVYITPSEQTMASFGVNSPYNTIEDLKNAKTIKIGTTGIETSQAMFAAMLADALQLKDFKIVSGYKATPDMMLAAAKGEVDMIINSGEIVREFIGKKMLKEPFLNMQPDKHPLWKNVPLFPEVVKLTAEKKTLYDVALTGYTTFGAAKLFFVAPGVPQDRVEFLRTTLYKMATDDAFNKDLVRIQPDRFGVYLGPPTKGEVIGEEAKKAYTLIKEQKEPLTALISKYLAIK